MCRSYSYSDNMLKIFLLVCCFRVLVIADESTPLGDVDEISDFQDEDSEIQEDEPIDDSEIQEDEPIDHSAFLQIDNTPDLHIPKQTNSIRRKIRAILKEMDSNTDGKVSEQELSDWIEKVMTEHLTSEGKIQMPKIDKDGDGLASWPEYASAAGYTQGEKPEPREDSERSKNRDKEKFDLADTNKDGKLSYYELGVMIHPNEASQMSSVVVTEFLEVMDKDRDKQLSFEEYIGEDPSLPALDKETKNELKIAFKALDFDQDGKLNNEELTDWLLPNNKPLHQNEAEDLMKVIDGDKDGDLTAQEIFKHYMKFATSRATRYGRMLKDEFPEDDGILEKKTKQDEKQNNKVKEEKQENESHKKDEKLREEKKDEPEPGKKKDEIKTKQDDKQNEKAEKEKKEKDEKKNEKHKPDDEL